jgi:L-fuconate dehydratase
MNLSSDDVLGHLAIARAMAPLGILVATGEHCANRILFKQFITSGAIGICQIDACRVGGVNEVLAIILMAAKVCIFAFQYLSKCSYIFTSSACDTHVCSTAFLFAHTRAASVFVS